MKQKLNWLLPSYTRLPLLFILVVNFLTYYGTKLVTLNAKHYDLTIGLDTLIPFVPFFISFYILAYPQWFFSYIFHVRESEQICYRIVTANIIAKTICILFFLFFPTEIQLPEVTGNGLWDHLTRFIYFADTPRTLFPSLHCLESWLCFRGAMYVKNKPKWYVPVQGVFSMLVFASTVFVKQHFVVDIFAGIAVAEIGLFFASKKNFAAFFKKIDLLRHKPT